MLHPWHVHNGKLFLTVTLPLPQMGFYGNTPAESLMVSLPAATSSLRLTVQNAISRRLQERHSSWEKNVVITAIMFIIHAKHSPD